MSQRHTDLYIANHDMLAGWAASATRCWLVLSAAAVLAGMAYLFDLI